MRNKSRDGCATGSVQKLLRRGWMVGIKESGTVCDFCSVINVQLVLTGTVYQEPKGGWCHPASYVSCKTPQSHLAVKRSILLT